MSHTVIHIAPHPDDEALGAPVTLLRLRDEGWRVVDLVVSLGRSADEVRRRAEATEAARIAGFELLVPDPPFAISGRDDSAAAQASLTTYLAALLREEGAQLVVSPSPHDGHHGHEVVGRAVAGALAQVHRPPPWSMWGLWADLPVPTIYLAFDEHELDRARSVLDASAGELARNDYARLLAARAAANAVLGVERVFGFGAARTRDEPYAELLTELHRIDGRWELGRGRELDVTAPLVEADSGIDVSAWLASPSPRAVVHRNA